MRIVRVKINNFRGIKSGEIYLNNHTALVGDNNSGKSTVLEAIDLVLGPERLARISPINEHDFYAGNYVGSGDNPILIDIEVVVVGLSDEQIRHFNDHLEWWSLDENALIDGPPPESIEPRTVVPTLRVAFNGKYDEDEDDFVCSTHFCSPLQEDGNHAPFRKYDKRMCGFLFLRTLRTGSRALSLERGSLLDIILRLKEMRLKMWEHVLDELRKLPVAEDPSLGLSEILSTVQSAIREYLPSEDGENPHMRVSALTRESLRKALTVFMASGVKSPDGDPHAVPFQYQGTGTINMLVLALLSLIAELKQNVIFAMEEPEIAIPPHTQKRIVDSLRKKSAQTLFTSHSPYVLEEFDPECIQVLKRMNGVLTGAPASLPPAVKLKKYRTEFRTRFCEAVLSRRVLILEGQTEFDAIPAAARKLNELHPEEFNTLEAMGIATINACSDSQVAPLGEYFSNLGKTVFAIFDKQSPENKAMIESKVPHAYENPESGLEKLIVGTTAESALRRFSTLLVDDGEWPTHLAAYTPKSSMSLEELKDAIERYLKWSKGSLGAAELLGECTKQEMPSFIIDTLLKIQEVIIPTPVELSEPDAEEVALSE